MALQIRRGTNAERLGITLVEGEVVYVTDFELATIEVTSINASTNVLTTTLNHGLTVNQKIKFQGTTGNGLTNDQVYFVKTIPSQVEFTLSTTQGGGTLDITGSAASLIFATGPTDATGTPYGYSISPLYVGDGITAGGNPAGASILDDLYDVSIGVYGNVGQYGEALANNNVIQYNSTTDQWENRANLTLNGVAYINGDNLYINYDANAVDSRIYFQGTTAEIKYDTVDGRFELNKDLIATGLQGGNIQIGLGDDNQIYNGSSNLKIDTQAGYHISSNAEFRTTAEAIYINSNNDNTPSTLYFKGSTNYIRLNTATGYFEFTDNIAKQDLLLSSTGTGGTIATGSGALNLNTPVGQSVNVQRDLVVGGNLTVNGTTTTVNSTTLTVDDKNIELASVTSPTNITADGGGITLKGATDKKIVWNNSNGRWSIDNGNNIQYVIPINIDDLNDVVITGTPVAGQFLHHNGTNWVNDNRVTSTASLDRAVFEYKDVSPTAGVNSTLYARKNFGATTYTTGSGAGMGFQIDSDSQALKTVAAMYAVDDASPYFLFRTSTDNFVTNSVDIAKIAGDVVNFNGTTLKLNYNGTGSAGVNAQIVVERGTSGAGADATLTWDESTDLWSFSDSAFAANSVIGGNSIGTNGNDIYFNMEDGGAGATSTLTVKRGSNLDVALRWNETSDRWETTTDGTNYINIPNQGLDTGNSPSFLGVTAGNIRVGVTTDNQIDTTSGDLTLDAPTVIVNGSLSVTGSTTLGNGTGDTVTITSGTVNIGTTLTSTITVGDAATDTLTVNATSTFNNNLTVGSDSTDTLTVNSTANFNNNVTVGSSSTDILTVNAAANLLNDVSLAEGPGNNTVTIGSTNLDELYVNATTYINNNLDIGSTSGDTLSVNSQVDTDIQFKDATATARGVRGTVGSNDTWFVGGYAATSNNGSLIIATADDGTEPIYVRQYSGTILSGTVTKELTLLDGSGNTSIPGSLTVAGDLTVNGTTTTIDTTNLVIEDNMIVLNKNEAGAGVTAGTAGIEIERGSLTNVTWQFNEANDWWEPNGPAGTMNIWATNSIIAGGTLATNDTSIVMNFDDGAGADAELRVKKGGGNWAALKWNNATNRWQITGDNGSTFVTLPNQNLDTTDSPTFAGATVDNIRIGVTTANTIDTSTGNLRLNSNGGTLEVDDNMNVDSGVLYVDAANNRVGVNTITPAYALDVNGSINANNSIYCTDLVVDALSTYNTQTTTTTATTVTSISSTTRASQKVVIRIIDNVTGEIHMLEALAFRKGTTAYLTTYAEMYSSAALATFTADVSGGAIRILATPASTNSTTFTVARISLD